MSAFIPDPTQQKIIDFHSGYALVLAAPGCGKTELLSHRVLKAHIEYGVPYNDMLCVTFTNRASREMRERIIETLGENPKDLYVGNLHRFCIRFLYDNGIIPIDTGLMDDTDQDDLIREFFGEYEPKAWQVQAVINTATAIREIELNIPEALRCHEKNERFLKFAQEYLKFLSDNKMIDFDDILLNTYKALSDSSTNYSFVKPSYNWIQIDEVQDLNPLQFAIIDCLTAPNSTIVYLGDERQAIYSFLGAKHDCIEGIIRKSNGNIMHLSNNYRSPMYLLDMLNDFATDVIGIDIDRLPTTTNNEHIDDALTCVKCDDSSVQSSIIAAMTRQIYNQAPDETVGILVKTNQDAEVISNALNEHKIKHIKITNKDMFKMIPFKTIHSHFSIVSLDTCYSEWGRILYQTHCLDKLSEARRCVRKMRDLALTPRDLIDYDNSSYIIEYCRAISERDIVAFDTETTGLDIFNDDIIQIAACKLHKGEIIPGSQIDIIIKTNKEIPATLKDGYINPMVAEYKRRASGLRNNDYEYFMNAQEAFKFFVEYVGNCELLGHNSNYDIHILENNIKRRTNLSFYLPLFWDTLLVSRLLDPNLRSHALEKLLETYDLEGNNSHNAIDDVMATVSLSLFCKNRCLSILTKQRAFLHHPVLKTIQRKLIKNYLPLYRHTKDKLYDCEICEQNTFDYEFKYVFDEMLSKKYIKNIPLFDYMRQLFNKVVISPDDQYFNHQVTRHLYELRTFNEADLYENGIINENIHIMTIHKAKGLQFDSVFVHNVSYGVFPHYYSQNIKEDARVLYVAMSRARKRVFITYQDSISQFIEQHDKVKEHFYFMTDIQRDRIMKFEEMFVKYPQNSSY